MRKGFGKRELERIFGEIGGQISRQVEIYLLGGGAMCLRNQKAATKDLDLVFRNEKEFSAFRDAVRDLGFKRKMLVEEEYEEMKAEGIWENDGGFRLDLFVETVCRALKLSEGIIKRSKKWREYGNLRIFLVSNEDVVLFKGITERIDDTNDIAAIARSMDVDWDVVLGECIKQSMEVQWYGLLHDKFVELEERHGISVPIKDELLKLDRVALLKNTFKSYIEKGMEREHALKKLKEKGFTEKELEEIE